MYLHCLERSHEQELSASKVKELQSPTPVKDASPYADPMTFADKSQDATSVKKDATASSLDKKGASHKRKGKKKSSAALKTKQVEDEMQ